jgi:lipid A ethanolaminephosphotransferase
VNILAFSKKSLSVHRVALLVSALIVALFNQSLWREVLRLTVDQDPTAWFFPISLFFVLLFTINAVLTILAWPVLFKPIAIALILISVSASYFMDAFGILIDREMIRNLLETDVQEASDLISLGVLAHFAFWGGVPAYLILRQPISYRSWFPATIRKLVLLAVSAVIVISIVMLGFKHYSAFFSNNRHVRHLIAPVNVIYSTTSLLKRIHFNTPKQFQLVGTDARPGAILQQSGKRALLVLVVGETARADHFSLQGYERETNPKLKEAGGIYFSNVSSCGTATATSIPCMFSADTRETFSNERARHTEGFMDVASRAGVRVIWLENNSGCKGICNRTEFEKLSHQKIPGTCVDGECFDEILEMRLEEILKTATGPLLVVLHQRGSHGPAYYKRYPAKFKQFTPVCTDAQLDRCPRQDIVNAYDNTLLYTDSTLAGLTKMLGRNSERFDSALLYISDHGESLGENGVYLHGMPYAIAPKAQTHVPMYIWFSPDFAQTMQFDQQCSREKKANPYSHDNLFHTVLGMLDIKTEVYQSKLDMFSDCRN